ncbi:PilZ domain-containing protein [Vibrio ziniensis]|uniref:Cyclic diguanosine monophosphate-binding protein n=1 Tax=Vibrio ziniensis TaxID=2711221 RepID=A0A6G7CFY6_9VIBR|nr:PilZ domain-containing protein [Vibrio ziniensis]QIH41012.1 PilZ domain-containing protein [Vibrio ziniensis]
MIERRRFSRIIYQAPATLTQGNYQLTTCIQDLSLKGLLLWAVDEPELDTNSIVDVTFTLPDSDISINLSATLIMQNERILHLKIDHIDIESVGHLRRLVELNVGSDELLHRELEHLVDLADYVD